MAFDEKLADRVRAVLAGKKGIEEKPMMGGLAYMSRGHMSCGVLKGDLVVRVGPERYQEAMAKPFARPMDFTGRPIKGFLFVGPGAKLRAPVLKGWIEMGLAFTASLPPKKTGKQPKK